MSYRMLEGVAFLDQLEKTAVNWGSLAHRAMSGAGSAAVGAGVGAVGGAAYGAATADPAKGESRVVNAFRGAGRGALGGAAVGGLGGALAGPKALAGVAKREDSLGSVYRSGQRALHSVTGMTPEGGVAALRTGAWDDRKRVADLVSSGGSKEEISKARNALKYTQDAEDKGLTSLPGYAKAVRRDGLLPTMKRDLSATWHGGGTLHKSMVLGMPALGAYSAATDPRSGGQLGEGKGEHYGRVIGNTLGASVGSVMPIVGNTIAGEGLSTAGQYIGRGVDWTARKLRGGAEQ